MEELGLEDSNSFDPPYISGFPFDKIPYPSSRLQTAQEQVQSVVGSLNWLACGTLIDIATITNMLAQHLHYATPLYVEAARYVVNYIKGYKSLGIMFTTQQSNDISAFLNFHFSPNKFCVLTDANWGSQDALEPDTSIPPEH